MSDDFQKRFGLIQDPIRRNFAITSEYHALSRAMASRLGQANANWLTFGAWASFSAGRFIRGEIVPVRWGARAVADGNLAIICDIGPRFTRFLAMCDEYSPSDLRDAVSQDPLLTESGNLTEAFDCYAIATGLGRSTDATTDLHRAQLILRANILVAHHEQDFADPFVDAAIPLGGVAGILGTQFVKITTPDGDLDVCRDVPQPGYLAGDQWPAALTELRDKRLQVLIQGYGQTLRNTRYSNATTWESLAERMGYICCFFRAYQQDPALFTFPNSA